HGLTLKPYLALIGERNNFCFRSVTNDRYPPIPNLDKKDIDPGFFEQYEKLSLISEDKLRKSKIIIIAKYWGFHIPSFTKALESLIKSLDEDQQLILLSDYPILNGN